MSGVNLEHIQAAIRPVPDFPQPGILFRDITPVLADADLFREVIDLLAEKTLNFGAEKVVGIDARGFLFGAAVAYKLGLGFVPIRKKGSCPPRRFAIRTCWNTAKPIWRFTSTLCARKKKSF